ncbi:MAG: hypothetical protein GF349_02565 [Candidatus Magasanikbacteria bacterium]|nr:hypothetical protein [Candidatus Magasanikbacteria bacterium]
MLKTLFISLACLGLLFPSVVMGQGLRDATGNLQGVAQQARVDDKAELSEVVGSIINGALTLVGLVFLVLMVYAGYLWMTARGNEEQVEKSKKIITASIIGLVIVVSAYAITTFVTSRFQ